MQAICNHSGSIIWYSGTHNGVDSDIKLWRDHSPPLERGEQILGDKAYVGHHRLIAPHKLRRGEAELSRRKKAYNIAHSWYRATIEHCFAFIKRCVLQQSSAVCIKVLILITLLLFCCRYAIIGTKYRGRHHGKPWNLDNALKIIIHISSAYTQRNPQRTYRPIEGVPPAPEPPGDDDIVVNTGVRLAHLAIGQVVSVWWAVMNCWWPAKVHKRVLRENRVTLLLEGIGYVRRIMPQHIRL